MEFVVVNTGRPPAVFIRDHVMQAFRDRQPQFAYTLTIRETPTTGRVLVEVNQQDPATPIEPGRLLLTILYHQRRDDTYQIWVGSEPARTIAPESLPKLLADLLEDLR